MVMIPAETIAMTDLEHADRLAAIRAENEALRRDLHATLKAVLHHFGPEGAHKVTTSALVERMPAGADTGRAVGVGPLSAGKRTE